MDITFATKEIMREAANPTWASMAKLKRLIRYLKGRKENILSFQWIPPDAPQADVVLHVIVDSDWTGCPKTRCSTSGGVMRIQGTFLKHWSGTQTTVSHSSAEAEAKAIAKGCAEALHVKHLLEGQGFGKVLIQIWTDTTGAKAITNRQKTRKKS